MHEEEEHISFKDIAIAGGGALIPFLPLELIGQGEAGVVAALIAGVVSYVYSDEIMAFARKRIPALQDPEKLKQWLLSRAGTDETDLPADIEITDEDVAAYMQEHGLSEPTEDETDQDQDDAQHNDLPVAPLFRAMCHLLSSERVTYNEQGYIAADQLQEVMAKVRLVLCYDQNGPVWGSLIDLLSICVVGKPGRGKSSAFLYYVALLARQDIEIHMWDPHASLSELTTLGLRDFHYTDDRQVIPDSVAALDTELEDRRQLYRRTKQVKRPLLLLIDELPVVGSFAKKHCPDIFELIEKFCLEARKWNCYIWLAGQSTDAEILPTRVRDNLASRVIFYTSDERARMAGLDTPTIKALMPPLKPDIIKGRMIFDCARLSEPFIGAIPYATINDVRQFLTDTRPQMEPLRPNVTTFQNAHNGLSEHKISPSDDGTFRRNDDDEWSSEEDGTGQNEVVSPELLPPGWTREKLQMFPGYYRVFNHLDKALQAVDVSQSQRNRDFGRNVLRLEGLWRDK